MEGWRVDIHLRQALGRGYGVTLKDAALVQVLLLKYLNEGQQLTLRFDTLKTVSQEFVIGVFAGLSDKVPTEIIMENLRLLGFPMDHMFVLEILVWSQFNSAQTSSAILRSPDGILRVSRLVIP